MDFVKPKIHATLFILFTVELSGQFQLHYWLMSQNTDKDDSVQDPFMLSYYRRNAYNLNKYKVRSNKSNQNIYPRVHFDI